MYQKIHNQINNILLKLMKTNEKFNTAVNNDMERQKEKFLEMKNFKKENIVITLDGEHKDYLKSFYMDTFYNQSEKKTQNV